MSRIALVVSAPSIALVLNCIGHSVVAAPAELLPVLTSANFERLCVGSFRGSSAVAPDVLALALASRAPGVLEYLDGASASGARNGAIDLVTDRNTPSEPAFAVRRLVLDPTLGGSGAGEQPFGPAVDYSSESVRQASDALQYSIGEMIFEINKENKIQDDSIIYRIVDAQGQPIKLSSGESINIHIRDIFVPDPTVIILCERASPTGGSSSPVGEPASTAQPAKQTVLDLIRLRGDVPSLLVAQRDLADAVPAQVGLFKDFEADTRTVTLNGVLGVSLQHPDGDWQMIPYLSYQRTETDGDDDDINAVTPGLVGSYAWSSAAAALRVSLAGSYLIDIEQAARVGNVTLSADPTWQTAVGPLFGGYLTPLGPIRFRPELRLTARSGWIFDEGNERSEFLGAQSYAGLGGIIGVQARLDYGQPWSDFLFSAGLEDLRIVAGDIDRNDVKRWTAGLQYAPKNFPYIGLGFNYSNGDNPETFQSEDYYRVGVDLRY